MTQDQRNLILRTVAGPQDININGNIFGGWILSQMDIAGGITAHRRANKPVATVAVNAMTFINPMIFGDVISLYTRITRVGRTSMSIDIDVEAVRMNVPEPIEITTGTFVFVAIGPDGRPTPVDGPLP